MFNQKLTETLCAKSQFDFALIRLITLLLAASQFWLYLPPMQSSPNLFVSYNPVYVQSHLTIVLLILASVFSLCFRKVTAFYVSCIALFASLLIHAYWIARSYHPTSEVWAECAGQGHLLGLCGVAESDLLFLTTLLVVLSWHLVTIVSSFWKQTCGNDVKYLICLNL